MTPWPAMSCLKWTILVVLTASVSMHAAEIRVSSAADIERASNETKAGDVLVLKDGTWRDQIIAIHAKGRADKPITLRAETAGKVVLTGKSALVIDGEH